MHNISISSPVYFNNVESVIIKHLFETLSDNVFHSSSLKLIDLPDTITQIVNYCFYQCSSLNSLDIPENVKTINSCCFHTSSLKSIKLYQSVSFSGSRFFDG
jgi:hypothetical protein